MSFHFYKLFVSFLFVITSFPVSARCAVCYTNGMSGASIALLVILSFFFVLFIANWTLKKFLNRN